MNDRYFPLTAEDIALILKMAKPIKITLLIITGVFIGFGCLVSYNLPYFWVFIGTGIFPVITFGIYLYVHITTKKNLDCGQLRLIDGIIEEKFERLDTFQPNRSIQSRGSIDENFFIVVNGNKLRIDENDYIQIKIGDHVKIAVTIYNEMIVRFIELNSMKK